MRIETAGLLAAQPITLAPIAAIRATAEKPAKAQKAAKG